VCDQNADLAEPGQGAVEGELLPAEKAFKGVGELSSEHLTEYALGQEEASTLRPHPLRAAGGEASGRHDAMNVRMMDEGLPLGVQHAQKADLGP